MASATAHPSHDRSRRDRSRLRVRLRCNPTHRWTVCRWVGRPSPEDLFVDDAGEPVRIDKAFSWEYPLSVHGLMHNVITNAWRGDPYPIDTLLLFMANMAWNSSMNTGEVRKMLTDKNEDGEPAITSPQFSPQARVPGQKKRRGKWQAYIAGRFGRK